MLSNVKDAELQGDAANVLTSILFKRGVARAVYLKRRLDTVARSSTNSSNKMLLFEIEFLQHNCFRRKGLLHVSQ